MNKGNQSKRFGPNPALSPLPQYNFDQDRLPGSILKTPSSSLERSPSPSLKVRFHFDPPVEEEQKTSNILPIQNQNTIEAHQNDVRELSENDEEKRNPTNQKPDPEPKAKSLEPIAKPIGFCGGFCSLFSCIRKKNLS